MVDRRDYPRTPVQDAIDLRAIEVAREVKGQLDGHMALDTERFTNLQNDLIDLKGDVRDLSTKQEGYHKDNKTGLDGLKSSVVDLAAKITTLQGERSGAKSLTDRVLDFAKIAVPIATLLYVMFGPHK